MSKKPTPSIASLLEEDKALAAQKAATETKRKQTKKTASTSNSTTKGSRMSFTLPKDIQDQLLQAALTRRIADKPYQINQIMREAVVDWLASNS